MLLRGRPSVPCGARVDVAFGASAGIAASLMPTIPEWRWLVIPTPKCLCSKPRSAYETLIYAKKSLTRPAFGFLRGRAVVDSKIAARASA